MTNEELATKYRNMLTYYVEALETQQTMPGVRWPEAQRFYREMIDWLTGRLAELEGAADDTFERVARVIL